MRGRRRRGRRREKRRNFFAKQNLQHGGKIIHPALIQSTELVNSAHPI